MSLLRRKVESDKGREFFAEGEVDQDSAASATGKRALRGELAMGEDFFGVGEGWALEDLVGFVVEVVLSATAFWWVVGAVPAAEETVCDRHERRRW